MLSAAQAKFFTQVHFIFWPLISAWYLQFTGQNKTIEMSRDYGGWKPQLFVLWIDCCQHGWTLKETQTIILFTNPFFCWIKNQLKPTFHSLTSRNVNNRILRDAIGAVTVFGLAPLSNCLIKKINQGQGTGVFTQTYWHLLAWCVLKHVCTRLIILTGRTTEIQMAESGQLAVGNRHPPLQLQIYFSYCRKCWPALTACTGRKGVCEKVGSGVKWASGYNWYYVNQYARGLIIYCSFGFLCLYFKIFNSLFSKFVIFFSLPIHP